MSSTNFYEKSLWELLREEKRPIFLYGTGNGGDKIIAALEKYGVTLTGVFASDGFVRSRTFHDMPVRAYSNVTAEFGDDIVVLLAFGTTLPEVRAFIEMLDQKHTLCIPDVPLYGGDLFDGAYFSACRERLEQVQSLLWDERSREIFLDAVNFRLSGKMKYLLNGGDHVDELREVFAEQKIHTIIDGGAFKGDSAADFIEALAPEKIIAVEADERTCGKLSAYAETVTNCNVIPVNAALWNENGEMIYVSSASRGSAEGGKNRRAKEVTVHCRTLDDIAGEESVDFIKLDVEGAESRALQGGEKTILRDKPNLAISLYHQTDDIMELTERAHALLPHHRLILRRADCIPFWDLTLYAIRENL